MPFQTYTHPITFLSINYLPKTPRTPTLLVRNIFHRILFSTYIRNPSPSLPIHSTFLTTSNSPNTLSKHMPTHSCTTSHQNATLPLPRKPNPTRVSLSSQFS